MTTTLPTGGPLAGGDPGPLRYTGQALVLGRALHAPWNEGTRVITRNFAGVAARYRPVRLVSLTKDDFRRLPSDNWSGAASVEHVFARGGYGLVGVYRGLPGLVRQIETDARTGPPEVAHLFGMPLSLAPRLRRRGTRVVVHVMTAPATAKGRLLNTASRRMFGAWVDAYAVTSRALATSVERPDATPSKIVVLPPALDTTVFRPGDRLVARRALGLGDGESLIIYLGRLTPRRFPAAEIARGLRDLTDRISTRLRFAAISPGPTHDGSENTAAYLHACTQAARAALRDIPGVTIDVRSEDLDQLGKVTWLQAADAVVLPFAVPEAVEPPLTLLEALACGASVFVTPAANRSQIVRDGYNGYVHAEPASFAEPLSRLLQDPAQRTPGRLARHTVDEQFGFDAVGNALVRLWDCLQAPSITNVRGTQC